MFLGIETPDAESLERTLKHQNLRQPLEEAVDTITAAGIRVMAGFIIGFDGEAPGAGARIVSFVERTAIPVAFVSLLQALPGTALWDRLDREGRLRDTPTASGNNTYLTNFRPTRPLSQMAGEFVEAFERLYEPRAYLDRTWRYFLRLGAARQVEPPRGSAPSVPEALRLLVIFSRILWRQGVARRTRWRFWHHLASILRRRPGSLVHYVTVCALNEHFLKFRQVVRRDIGAQLEAMTDPRRPTVWRSNRGSVSKDDIEQGAADGEAAGTRDPPALPETVHVAKPAGIDRPPLYRTAQTWGRDSVYAWPCDITTESLRSRPRHCCNVRMGGLDVDRLGAVRAAGSAGGYVQHPGRDRADPAPFGKDGARRAAGKEEAVLTSYLTRWSALAVWAVVVGGAWTVFVPGWCRPARSASLRSAVPRIAILVRMVQRAHDPAPSFGQERAVTDAADARARVRR